MSDYPLKWITESLAVGYAPNSEDDLRVIQAAGIGAIVNLCAECYDLHEAQSAFGFEVNYLPVVDESVPTLEELEARIDWIQQQIEAGKRVLVHCRYGIGRTGTLVLAFLLDDGHRFSEAREMMAHTPAWPATRDQEELVDQLIVKRANVSVAGKFDHPAVNPVSKYFERWKQKMKW